MKLHERISGGPFAIFLALMIVSGGFAGVAAAANTYDASTLNYGSDYVPDPGVHEKQLEKETHRMGSMDLTEYENDNGEVVSLQGHLNDSKANPISLRADKINATDYRNAFGENGGSAINASLWTVGGANSSKGSVSSSTTPAGVTSVKFATDGSMGSGDKVTFTFDASVTQDPNKRVAQIVANINTLDSGTEVKVAAADADGDDKVIYVNSSKNADSKNVLANSTVKGAVLQHKLGDLATTDISATGAGDGTFEGIETIEIVVVDGDVSMNVAGMNYEKMSKWTFGEKAYDGSDDDSDKDERKTHTEPSGYISVTGLDTLGSTFSEAVLHDVRFPVIYDASDLKSGDVKFEVSKTAEGKYPGYGFVVDAYYRISVPSAYDLVHSGLEFRDSQEMPSSRYKTVEIAEGVGDTAFSDISSWSDVTDSYSSEGATVSLDSTVEPGKEYAVHYEYVITESNKDTLKKSVGAPVGGGKEGSGGIVGSIMAIIASILGVLGIGKGVGKLRG